MTPTKPEPTLCPRCGRPLTVSPDGCFGGCVWFRAPAWQERVVRKIRRAFREGDARRETIVLTPTKARP